ncbi:Gfo/Idh/MocA family protein [Synechococcus sp. RS9916]|uniref:Gfo/Idh/MocA family protein n=1 Tax=Synechococcus sp. RS9916 TaxID=221359 RepID=UPI0009041029|nr:Gfo/Idh/MocA family oxidoreductase [Synechococcus sp. RS9916]
MEGCKISKILICGLGSIGKRHFRVLKRLYPFMKIGALRSGYGLESKESNSVDITFSSLDESIKWSPNAAIIASPAPYHLATAIRLARSGIPLLIEKPIGTGFESTDLWNELLAISQDLPILIGYVFRHDKCLSKVINLLNSNLIGNPVELDIYCGSWLPDWRPNQDYKTSVSSCKRLGGGVLLELSHEIDLAFRLFSDLQLESCLLSLSRNLEIDVEDNAVLVLRSSRCQSIVIRINFCTTPPKRFLSVRGTSGEISWNLAQNFVSLHSRQLDTVFHSHEVIDDLYFKQIKHFFACIEGQESVMCTVEDGLKVISLIAQAKSISS